MRNKDHGGPVGSVTPPASVVLEDSPVLIVRHESAWQHFTPLETKWLFFASLIILPVKSFVKGSFILKAIRNTWIHNNKAYRQKIIYC